MHSTHARLEALAEQMLALHCLRDPIEASLLGVPGYDALLADLSREVEERLAAGYDAVVAGIERLDVEALGEEERRTAELLAHRASVSAPVLRLGSPDWQVSNRSDSPVGSLVAGLPQLSLDTEARRLAYRLRLSCAGTFLATAGARQQDAARRGRTPVARLVGASLDQLDAVLADPALSGISRPGCESVAEEIARPAIADYRETVSALLAAGRDDDHAGLCHLPGGEGDYEVLVRFFTGGGRSAAELHQLGLELTQRLGEEYAVLGEKVFGTSSREEVFHHLREDAGLRYTSAAEMLRDAEAAVRRAEAAAPAWFRTFPAAACLVEAVPPLQQAGSAPAYYLQPALDGSRAGTYFLNTSAPGERHRFQGEAIAFHEAVPGHHFQLSIAQQRSDLPLARRLLYDNAGAEGWGLYAERLADEMGLYSSDLARLGMLSADSWRAGRLVVDSGLHALGWTREQAVSWMVANTPQARLDIESEVDRYVATPGQALGYMVGRVELQDLRADAARRLGARFDVRSFHDVVLGAGPLPLPVLRSALDRWVAAQP